MILHALPIIFCMFYTALISYKYYYNNDDNIEKFLNIDIYSNYVFLSILIYRLLVAPTAVPTNWVPVTDDPHGNQRVKVV